MTEKKIQKLFRCPNVYELACLIRNVTAKVRCRHFIPHQVESDCSADYCFATKIKLYNCECVEVKEDENP
jgi:hypothetical protein